MRYGIQRLNRASAMLRAFAPAPNFGRKVSRGAEADLAPQCPIAAHTGPYRSATSRATVSRKGCSCWAGDGLSWDPVHAVSLADVGPRHAMVYGGAASGAPAL
jgi:hypothetical protein